MISKESNSCSAIGGGENLEKALIYFEEEVSTSLSPVSIHPVLCSTHTIANKEKNNQNITSCSCVENDIMRQYPNNQKKFWFYSPSHRYYYSHLTTKRKLLFLVFVASLAFLSIILISEQLIVRHLSRKFEDSNELYTQGQGQMNPFHHVDVYEEFDILTLEDWALHETIDFDANVIALHGGQEEKVSRVPENVDLTSTTTTSKSLVFSKLVEDGIFWSSELEAAVPPGPTDQGVLIQMQELRDRKIKSLESPNWLHCGREKNRFVHFEDGSNACARYRGPDHAEFVQGELMAFYLARLLGITNTPAVVLSEVR